ncbi:MAG: hypothetical protein ABSA23_04215 [Anaerolineales bacterium]
MLNTDQHTPENLHNLILALVTVVVLLFYPLLKKSKRDEMYAGIEKRKLEETATSAGSSDLLITCSRTTCRGNSPAGCSLVIAAIQCGFGKT